MTTTILFKFLIGSCVVLAQILLVAGGDWQAHCNHSSLPVFPSETSISNAIRKLDTHVWVNARQQEHKIHQIPLKIWVTVKEVPVHVPPYHLQMLHNNSNFNYLVVSDDDADLFMNEVFHNTSYLWAYHSMNKQLGAGKADIFRYAVMYVFGGAYVDSDAAWTYNLEHYIRPEDGFIVGAEVFNASGRPCYQSSFYLGNNNITSREFTRKLPWQDRITAQFMLVARPKHQFIARTMIHLVDVFRRLKCFGDKGLFAKKIKKDSTVLCSTGPDLMTASVISCLQEIPQANWSNTFGFRYAGLYYEEVGGLMRAKPGSDVQGPGHWTNLVNKGVSLFDE